MKERQCAGTVVLGEYGGTSERGINTTHTHTHSEWAITITRGQLPSSQPVSGGGPSSQRSA